MPGRPWKTTEITKLREWYDVLSVREIADRLGTSQSAVYSQAHRLGINRPDRYIEWSQTETAKLRAWYGRIPVIEISERLGKSYSAIYSKASRMGLAVQVDYRDVTEIKRLIRLGWSETQIAEHLGITKQSLWERLNTPAYSDVEREKAAKNWRRRKEHDSQSRSVDDHRGSSVLG